MQKLCKQTIILLYIEIFNRVQIKIHVLVADQNIQFSRDFQEYLRGFSICCLIPLCHC